MTDAAATPPGWSTNPSAWRERLLVVGLAVVGVCVATYLTLFQLGVLDTVWDPFFGDGTRAVLTSKLSESLPVPDALLGALAYVVDCVLELVGDEDRWRTQPWVVLALGANVSMAGLVSIGLAIVQPTVIGAWCTLCLASATLSVVILGLASDELLASCQYLRRVHDDGGSLWTAFWKGSSQVAGAGRVEA
ncbi:vitamin K epoxide reductase family protein [Halomarina salina]|uniref:Vitamin K epoxide reductase family protein n=1 Tax=Halomarina salina TaxID=1872699 RepID=A0ABD5RPU4_9EURY|nr:vitamin K epoxide reductase family protein [Halomarina salina]